MADPPKTKFFREDPEGQYIGVGGIGGDNQSSGGNPNANPLLGQKGDSGLLLNQQLGTALGGGLPAIPEGFASLMEVLQRRGRTDPNVLSRSLVANARGTEAQQQQQQGSAARRGVQNAGVTNAITAAIGAAGADREGAIRARDAEKQNQQQLQGLNTLLKFIQAMSREGEIAVGGDAAAKARKDRFLSSLINAGAGGVSDFFNNRDDGVNDLPPLDLDDDDDIRDDFFAGGLG